MVLFCLYLYLCISFYVYFSAYRAVEYLKMMTLFSLFLFEF